MIKVVAFDLVGVLVKEKDVLLTPDEDKIERLFGPNINDDIFILEAKKTIGNKDILLLAENIINKLYEVKDNNLIKRVKERYPDIKIVIATNHISLIRKYIEKNFDYIDAIFISSEIHMLKPNKDFFDYIINKFQINYNELLFLDDRDNNVIGASNIGINAIKVDNRIDIYKEIMERLDNENN